MNWLLGFLPAPIRGILLLVGVVAYIASLFTSGSIQSILQLVAGITGASGVFATAKVAQTTHALREAAVADSSPATEPSSPTDQKVDGHSQEAADKYKDDIFKP